MNKMKNKKNVLIFVLVLLLASIVIFFITKTSNENPGFDDKSKWENHEDKLKSLEQKMQEMSAEVKKRMGKGQCKYDDDCHVVGLGLKTCDGYKNFLIYSSKDTNEPELLYFVEQFNLTNKEFNELSLAVASCGEKPKIPYCKDNRCTVQ
jgi:hypothetical protein